jgi:hypothetical protein
MAYTGSSLSQINGTIEGGWKEWVYVTSDSLATVKGAGYFSDGANRGMEVGDFVRVVNTATPAYAIYAVSAVSAGAATVAGTAIVLT